MKVQDEFLAQGPSLGGNELEVEQSGNHRQQCDRSELHDQRAVDSIEVKDRQDHHTADDDDHQQERVDLLHGWVLPLPCHQPSDDDQDDQEPIPADEEVFSRKGDVRLGDLTQDH